MRYSGTVYRPPSEAGSLLVQVTLGCPHNLCTFCGMYKGTRFRVRRVEEVKEDLLAARRAYGDAVRTVFFPDGNTVAMKTRHLVEILRFTRQLFPRLERITVYGSARFLLLKSPEELAALREAGLRRVHSGMESGDDVTLRAIQKGVSRDGIIEAGRRVRAAGIELSEYVLIGVAGPERSLEHARASAEVLNAIDPEFIRLRTLVPIPGTPLFEQVRRGQFRPLSPHAALREVQALVRDLEGPGEVLSDHVSNYWDVRGRLPHGKRTMLQQLEQALSVDESVYLSRRIFSL